MSSILSPEPAKPVVPPHLVLQAHGFVMDLDTIIQDYKLHLYFTGTMGSLHVDIDKDYHMTYRMYPGDFLKDMVEGKTEDVQDILRLKYICNSQ